MNVDNLQKIRQWFDEHQNMLMSDSNTIDLILHCHTIISYIKDSYDVPEELRETIKNMIISHFNIYLTDMGLRDINQYSDLSSSDSDGSSG